MPYSFFEIERQKNWSIGFLFAFLVALYFLTFLSIWLVIKNFSLLAFNPNVLPAFLSRLSTFKELSIILVISFFVGFMHWSFSQFQLVERILGILKVEQLDIQDRYHQVLKNVIDEISIACGGVKFESCVIPVSALNAFAIADSNGRQVIGVTEGLLAKLNRRQLQAVIGHEVAHIISGDCLSATVACSLFELYSALLKRINFSLIYLILAITRSINYLVNMCISRQREYRADAISARLTRDPISLAEALYIISRGWKGEGISGDELSSIFIMSPQRRFWDEREGFLADMLSTHPPIKKRIEVLLGIAGKDIKFIEEGLVKEENYSSKETPPTLSSQGNKWYISNPDNQWTGPFDLSGLLKLDWLKPYFWVRREGEDKAKIAYQDNELKNIFKSSDTVTSGYSCPNCHHGLEEIDYEGTTVWRCVFCKRFLVKRTDVFRILFREEKHFSEEVIRKASLLKQDSKIIIKEQIVGTPMTIGCPFCQKKMHRVFLKWAEFIDSSTPAQWEKFVQKAGSIITPFPIDKCIWCDLFWFDGDKLEILQCLYEKFNDE